MTLQAKSVSDITIVPPGAGETMWIIGDRQCIKISSTITRGALLLGETMVLPGGGPPPHLHRNEHEAFYILEGDMQFLTPDCIYTAPVGSFFWAPRGVCHQFRNVGDKPARFILLVTPGAMETFFRSVATPCALDDHQPPPFELAAAQKVMSVAAEYGIETVNITDPARHEVVPPPREQLIDGIRVRHLKDESAHAGELAVDELHLPPGATLPATHSADRSRTLVVLEGMLELEHAGRTQTADTGAYVHLQPAVDAVIRNSGPGIAKVLCYYSITQP